VLAHCRALIDAAGPACVAAKPQLACFERLGAPGWAALADVVDHAHAAGLLVLADAKRGDIAVSAAAYGQALVGSTPTPFGDVPGLGADAFTASPYLGIDTLEVLLEAARGARAGMFVLVRTSNPGAADIEDAELASGGPLWERVARIVDDLGVVGGGAAGAAGAPGEGAAGTDAGAAGGSRGAARLHDVGAVVGATAPEHVARMRELMPRAVFLLPGIGAQGGRVEDLAPAFAPHRAAGLVTASRSIATAHERAPGTAPGAAARAEAERLRAAAWALA
jgi:orotidine-5'-phosphate decarboxylase